MEKANYMIKGVARIVTNGGASIDVDQDAVTVAEQLRTLDERRRDRLIFTIGKTKSVIVYPQHVAFILDDSVDPTAS